MVGVFVAFIRVVYGRTIYMSLPSSELTVDITIVHLVTGHFAPLPFLLQQFFPQVTLYLVELISKYKA